MSSKRQIVIIAHNLRSAHNVGSILRTADGLGVNRVYMTGYSPYPAEKNDDRLPHVAAKMNKQIHKTALGAENTITWQHEDNVLALIYSLRAQGFAIAALEQTDRSTSLPSYKPPGKIAIIVGREVGGIEPSVIEAASFTISIPMLGRKESFNVAQASAMALYHMRFAE